MALTQLYAQKPTERIVHSDLCFDKGLAEVVAGGARGLASVDEITLERDNLQNGNRLCGRVKPGILRGYLPFMSSPVYVLVRNGLPGFSQHSAEEATTANKRGEWFFVDGNEYSQNIANAGTPGEFVMIGEREIMDGNRVVVPFDTSDEKARLLFGGQGTEEEKTARVQRCIDYFKQRKPKLAGLDLYVPSLSELVLPRKIIATQLWHGGLGYGFWLDGDFRNLDDAVGVFGCVRSS